MFARLGQRRESRAASDGPLECGRVATARSEEHTSELQSRLHLACRLLLGKKHCYLDHDDHGEMTLEEIKCLVDQLAEAGVFFLTISGGEVLMRMDFFDILRYARKLQFNVKMKTNAFMIREKEADLIRALGVQTVQISIYSHRAEVHDGITKLPG